MKKIIQQNKNTCCKLATAFLVVVIVVSSCCFSVFASDVPYILSISDSPVSLATSHYGASYFDFTYSYSGSDIVFCGISSATSSVTIYFASLSSSSFDSLVVRGFNDSVVSLTPSTDNELYIRTLYFGNSLDSSYLPCYSSTSDFLSAVRDYIDNGGGGSASSELNYSLPPGNVAFIEVDSSNSFSLNTQFVEITGLFSGTFSKTSQTWGWSDSVVTSGSFPLSGHNIIPWAKGDKSNLLGQSHYGVASSTSLSGSGKYLVIYNPLYSFQNDSENNFEHNFNVNISCTAVKSITVVSLKGNLASGIESSWTLTSIPDGEVWTGEIDSETGSLSFIDSQGNSGNPSYGGDNYIADSTQNFRGWLNGVVSSVLGVLESGRNAIITLVSGASSFFAVLPSLYSWLPSPVLSVLISAMVLVLAIGVIKVFL